MNNHELCPTCKPYGHCLFKENADAVAKNVPPLGKQTLIEPNKSSVTYEAAKASQEIVTLREFARAKEIKCPFADYSPDFPGRDTILEEAGKEFRNIFLENNQR